MVTVMYLKFKLFKSTVINSIEYYRFLSHNSDYINHKVTIDQLFMKVIFYCEERVMCGKFLSS